MSYRKGWGYGTYAARDILPGELLERHEEKPFNLVSLQRVRKHWSPLQQRDFAQFAYPVSSGVYAMWSSEPADWRPFNHSCDPNAWLSGLDHVSRRAIPRGQAITLDYATFCDEHMETFACKCGSALCRGMRT